MKITLVEISRGFTDQELAMLAQNIATLRTVFDPVDVVLVQNAGASWSKAQTLFPNASCVSAPESQRSASANRLAGARQYDFADGGWCLFLDADMELMSEFAKFLKEAAPQTPTLAVCDRIDRNPDTQREKRIQPAYDDGQFQSLYGAFAVCRFDIAANICVVDDLEEQWMLRNITLNHPTISQLYLPQVGIVHHDAKGFAKRMGRHLFDKRCIGYWQGLAQRDWRNLGAEDFVFVFRGRSLGQKFKLAIAIFFAFFPFAWRRMTGRPE